MNDKKHVEIAIKRYFASHEQSDRHAILHILANSSWLAGKLMNMVDERQVAPIMQNLLIFVDHKLEEMARNQNRQKLVGRFWPWLYQTIKKEIALQKLRPELAKWNIKAENEKREYLDKIVRGKMSARQKHLVKAMAGSLAGFVIPCYELLEFALCMVFARKS